MKMMSNMALLLFPFLVVSAVVLAYAMAMSWIQGVLVVALS